MPNNPSPLLSICCLGYNHAAFLQDNLESILAINHPNIEVIVVDDGSTDNSVSILENISQNYPLPIKIIAQKNTGNIGKNFNTALSYTKGKLVTFISLDDVFYSKIIKKEIDIMINHPNVAFVASTATKSIDNQGFLNNFVEQLPTNGKTDISLQELLEYEYHHFGGFYIQGSIFRTDIIKAIGGFDEDMTGDDIILRTKLFRYLIKQNQKNNMTWQHIFLTDNNVFYRIHDNNIHKNTLRQIKIVTEYLDRYWSDRENPKRLVDWFNYYIKNNPNEIEKLFALNHRASTLQNEPILQETIRKQKDMDLTFIEKIYRRRRLANNLREIVLFNLFRFTYQRKIRKNHSQMTQTKKMHYKTL